MKPEELHAIAQELGFQFDADSSAIYGERANYLFVLLETGNKNQFRLLFSVKPKGEVDQVYEQGSPLQTLAKESSVMANLKQDDYLVTVIIKPAMTKKKAIQKVETALTELVQCLQENDYVQVCSQTGQEGEVGLYQLGQSVFIVNEASYQLLKNNLQLEVDSYNSQKENLVLGIVGAFLGALVGGAVALFIARLGYVSFIAGLALGVCTIKGYELLGKKITKKGIFVSALLMILTVFLVNQIDLAIELMNYLGIEFGLSFQAVNEMIFSGEVPENYFWNLGLLLVFTLGGAWVSVASTLSNHKSRDLARKIS